MYSCLEAAAGLPADIRFLPYSILPVKWKRKKDRVKHGMLVAVSGLDRNKMIILFSPKRERETNMYEAKVVMCMPCLLIITL